MKPKQHKLTYEREMKLSLWPKGTLIISRDGKQKGKTTGTLRPCQLGGCRGLRIGVRWPDGKITWPCSKGISGVKIV